jgi:hypothetical protein
MWLHSIYDKIKYFNQYEKKNSKICYIFYFKYVIFYFKYIKCICFLNMY